MNDGGGHIIFQYRDDFICILCDIWYPLKYSIKHLSNGWTVDDINYTNEESGQK